MYTEYSERKGTLETYNDEHTSETQDSRTTKKKTYEKEKHKNETKVIKVNYILLVCIA
jgi:hypothetical protein